MSCFNNVLPFTLLLLFLSFVFSQSDASRTLSTNVDILSSRFAVFDKPADLYKLIYEAHAAKVFSDNGVFVDSVAVDVAKGIPALKDFLETNGILVAGNFDYNAIRVYVDNNLPLRNMLTKEGIIDAAANYNPNAVQDIFTRYNPNTNKLDPKINNNNNNNNNALTLIGSISTRNITLAKFETVNDVYLLVLQAYSAGMIDQDGNFIETSFLNFIKEEPNLARLLRSSRILTDTTPPTIDYAAAHRFVEERPSLLTLLKISGVFSENQYQPKGVKDIIYKYNVDTQQLDLVPTIPVVDQVKLSIEAKAEIERNQKIMDESLTPTKVVTDLLKSPSTYLLDSLSYGRRNGVFDRDGNFDAYNFYDLLSTDRNLIKEAKDYGIFDENGNFYPSNLYGFVVSRSDLYQACLSLGILNNVGYDQEAVLVVVNKYSGKNELPISPFSFYDPATVNTPEDVLAILSRAHALKIIDEYGTLDFAQLQVVFDQDPVFKENVLNYAIIDGSVIKESRIRRLLTERPLLRTSLVKLGILDNIGKFDSTALHRAIVRSLIPTSPLDSSTSTVVQYTNTTSVETLNRFSNVLSQVAGLGNNPTASTSTTSTPTTATPTTSSPSTGATNNFFSNTKTTADQYAVQSTQKGTTDNKNKNTTIIVIICCVCGTFLIVFFIVLFVYYRKSNKPSKKTSKDVYHMV